MLSGSDADILWRTAQDLAAAWERVTPGLPRLDPTRLDPTRRPPPMVFVTDPLRTPEPWHIAQNLPAEAAVIYRAFGREDALAVGCKLRRATRGLMLVGNDVDLALALDADGVHLPERRLGGAVALREVHPHLWVSGAIHAGTDPAYARGLDMGLIAPVFGSGPTSAERPVLGAAGFRALASQLSCPALALGGITAKTVRQLFDGQAYGFAAVSAISQAFGGRQT